MKNFALTYGTVEFALEDRSIINITVNPGTLLDPWENCELFVDEFLNLLTPVIPEDSVSRISFIVNELVENAVKYSRHGGEPVEIDVSRKSNTVDICIVNDVTIEQWERFKEYHHRIESSDAGQLYSEYISSGEIKPLGILLLKKDVSLTFNTEFFSRGPGYYIRNRASIPLSIPLQ